MPSLLSGVDRLGRRTWSKVQAYPWIFVFWAAPLIAIVKYSHAFQPNMSFAQDGDGWGTIGWIYDIQQQFKEKGFSFLVGDLYHSTGIGAGLRQAGQPITFYWKFIYGFSESFFNPDNIYDFAAILGFLFTTYAGFFLGRTLKLPDFISFILAIALSLTDHFKSRATGHITFTHMYMPVLTVAFLVKLFSDYKNRTLFALTAAVVFNFIINEYYGYFGAIIGLLALLPLCKRIARPQENNSRLPLVVGLFIAILATILVMGLVYPNLIGSKIISLIFGTHVRDVATNYAHGASNFTGFAIDPGWAMFRPQIPGLLSGISDIMKQDQLTGEMTFRVGFVILLVSITGLVRGLRRPESRPQALALGLICLLGFCLALKPKYGLSLAPIAMNFAPMFRCGVRSLLYSQIAMLGLSGLALSHLWHWSKLNLRNGPFYLYGRLLVCAMLYLILVDLNGNWNPLSPLNTYELYHSTVYDDLQKRPDGLVLELPTPVFGQPPEAEYRYYLSRWIHHKPALNGIDTKFSESKIDTFFRINQLPKDFGKGLAILGVRYLVIHRDQFKPGPIGILDPADFQVLATDKNTQSYEIKGAMPWHKDTISSQFLYPPVLRFSGDHFDQKLFPVEIPFMNNLSPKPIHVAPHRSLLSTTTVPITAGSYQLYAKIISSQVGKSVACSTGSVQISCDFNPNERESLRLDPCKADVKTAPISFSVHDYQYCRVKIVNNSHLPVDLSPVEFITVTDPI
jgi:hypothetical protein